jgi:hypothetical protein
LRYTFHLCAIGATEQRPGLAFNAVSDDAAGAMIANRRERMYRALETIESVCGSGHRNFESLVVFVIADFTGCHNPSIANTSCNSSASGKNLLPSNPRPARASA